jgi:hypothetical protein
VKSKYKHFSLADLFQQILVDTGTMSPPHFEAEFYQSIADLGKSSPQFKWYMTAIVALGALNSAEEIPYLYELLLNVYIPKADHFEETKKIREGLTKVSGIMGAAKVSDPGRYPHVGSRRRYINLNLFQTGTALRALATVTPPELLDLTYYRCVCCNSSFPFLTNV